MSRLVAQLVLAALIGAATAAAAAPQHRIGVRVVGGAGPLARPDPCQPPATLSPEAP